MPFFHVMARRRRGIAVLLSGTQANIATVYALAGSPTSATEVDVTILNGAIVGQTNPALPAFDTGQFPAGSIIRVRVAGDIQGAAGVGSTSGVGGNGGDAIKANYPNQKVIITVESTGRVLPGGGGGGKGGTGGTGGTGGQGVYENIEWRYVIAAYDQPSSYWHVNYQPDIAECYVNGYWGSTHGTATFSNWYSPDPVDTTGVELTSHGIYRRGTLRYDNSYPAVHQYDRLYDIGQSSGNVYTSGGAGGAGGNGGNGGRGQGYTLASSLGSDGSGGVAGAWGGTNAGQGGTGGNGGSGGNGGAWGTNGNNGTLGGTGSIGGNGNYTAGSQGSAGSAGFSGGLSGRYLVKGTADVTFTNNGGTVVGTLA